jgi:hypothetical protein
MVSIPSELKGKELLTYLKANKSELIEAKKAAIKIADSVVANVTIHSTKTKETTTKAEDEESDASSDKNTLEVTVVCNTANICDSHLDVLTDDAYTESINLRGIGIPHIADHMHSSTAHVGDVTKVYTKKCKLKDLGLDMEGSTTALLMDTTIRKDYNEDVFKFYANGKINQHSIGLRYEEIQLALNSSVDEDKEEKAIWDKYYPNIINKEAVDKRGYFWAVPKVDVRENSCVLFGSNPLTPTLSVKSIQQPDVTSNVNNPSTTHKGNIMTNEETLQQLVEAQAQLATLKASQNLEVAKAVQEERKRVLNIVDAKKTFGIDEVASTEAIEKGFSLDMVTSMFTAIKAASDRATNINTSGSSLSGMTPDQLKAFQDAEALKTASNSFEAEIALGLKHLGEQQPTFRGIS